MMNVTIFAPSGVILEKNRLDLAKQRLNNLGFSAKVDPSATDRYLRFAGTDEARLAAIHRAAEDDSKIAMAARGGYGLSRLLDDIDWELLGTSVRKGKYWIGHSDFTALNLGLLAHTQCPSWAGPMALFDFGRVDASVVRVPGVDAFTKAQFLQRMSGDLQDAQFTTQYGLDGVEAEGVLWGSNLTVLCGLLGTPHWPDVEGGILFIEDINEPLYAIERKLIQLHSAGVLKKQKAILLGDFSGWRPGPLDLDYRFKDMLAYLRDLVKIPVLTDLPFGHIHAKMTLPIGVSTKLTVKGQTASLTWETGGFDAVIHRLNQEKERAKIIVEKGSFQREKVL